LYDIISFGCKFYLIETQSIKVLAIINNQQRLNMKTFLHISGLIIIAGNISFAVASPSPAWGDRINSNELDRSKRQLEGDNNAITSEYDLYADEYDSIDREGRADEEGEYDYGEPQDESEAALGLPSDSRSIRDQLVDVFSCEGRPYGYYADIANECQVFHICQPVTYADGETETFKWSMICPAQTVFDQSTLVCAFPLDAIPCEESEAFMDGPTSINARFGVIPEKRK